MVSHTTSVNVPPSLVKVLANYTPFAGNIVEAHEQPLWHKVTYPAGGFSTNSFSFFNQSETNSSPSITNLPTPNQLPNPQNFLVLGIEFAILPGVDPTTISTTGGNTWADDFATLALGPFRPRFKVNTKTYFEDTPIAAFPPTFNLNAAVSNALYDTAAATGNVLGFAWGNGQRRMISGIIIPSTTRFSVDVEADAPNIALPSGKAAEIICKLHGILYQLAQ